MAVDSSQPPSMLFHYAAAPDPQKPPAVLGSGSFAAVYHYTNSITGQEVAIKRIRLTGLEPLKARQLLRNAPRELRIHHGLTHPLIIKLLDVFLDNNLQYLHLVLEKADGHLLNHVNRRFQENKGHLPQSEARWLFQQLVVTLGYLHSKTPPVSHRDIKLENSLIKRTADPSKPVMCMADFGLSRFGELAGTTVGSIEYQAPEVLAANDDPSRPASYDPNKADIWSAGVLLYAVLAGNYPFDTSNPYLHEEQLQARPLQFPAHVPVGVRDLLEALLWPDAELRPTVQQVLQHPWVLEGMPPGALGMNAGLLHAPSPCAKSAEHLEGIIIAVQQVLQPQAGVMQ